MKSEPESDRTGQKQTKCDPLELALYRPGPGTKNSVMQMQRAGSAIVHPGTKASAPIFKMRSYLKKLGRKTLLGIEAFSWQVGSVTIHHDNKVHLIM